MHNEDTEQLDECEANVAPPNRFTFSESGHQGRKSTSTHSQSSGIVGALDDTPVATGPSLPLDDEESSSSASHESTEGESGINSLDNGIATFNHELPFSSATSRSATAPPILPEISNLSIPFSEGLDRFISISMPNDPSADIGGDLGGVSFRHSSAAEFLLVPTPHNAVPPTPCKLILIVLRARLLTPSPSCLPTSLAHHRRPSSPHATSW
jgi:hypothetical protein